MNSATVVSAALAFAGGQGLLLFARQVHAAACFRRLLREHPERAADLATVLRAVRGDP